MRLSPPVLDLGRAAPILGTFAKFDTPQAIEILALSGLDFAVADAEHAPLDRQTLDRMMLAGRAAGLPVLVRLPSHEPAALLNALDLGASGLLVPHVASPDEARAIVSRARFIGEGATGSRGISLSGRFAAYGLQPRAEAIAEADRIPILAQIECVHGLAAAEAIAQVPGIGGLFIGRSDLALSLGIPDPADPRLTAATQRIAAAAVAAGKLAAMAVSGPSEVARFLACGVRCFVVGSDQGLLRRAAADVVAALRSPAP